jgi:DDE superfamily endonuclease
MIVQVLSDLDGGLLTVSEPQPGRTHDRAGYSLAGYDLLVADIDTIGDLGYQGTPVIRPRRKRPGHREHTPADQVWNHSVSSLRVAVERAIGHIKNWKSSPPATADASPNSPTSSGSSPPSSTTDSTGAPHMNNAQALNASDNTTTPPTSVRATRPERPIFLRITFPQKLQLSSTQSHVDVPSLLIRDRHLLPANGAVRARLLRISNGASPIRFRQTIRPNGRGGLLGVGP